VSPVLADPRRQRHDPGARVLADVPPLVAVEDRGDEQADRHRQVQRVEAPLASHREVRPDDHQRAHQQEDERHAQRAVFVLERRRRVAPPANQAEQAEDDDRGPAKRDEVDPDDDRDGERNSSGDERRTLGQAALDDRVAGPRRGDRVDALADVVDLVDDVRPGMEEDRAGQRREERREAEAAVDVGERRPREHRDHRGGIREGSEDLPGSSEATPARLHPPEASVVGERARSWRPDALGRRPYLCRRRHSPIRDAFSHRRGSLGIERGRGQERIDLGVLLEHRLQEGQPEARIDVERHRLRSDVLARPTEHEGVEELVGDEVPGGGVVLGSPGGRDPVAQLGLETRPAQGYVRQDRHHVDDEGLALCPVERLAARPIDEREEVAGRLD